MSQIIKKQIKKTIPLFMIFSLLLSTSVAGLVFNLDFKIVRTMNKRLGLEFGVSTAKADVASTTVTVKNAPPALVGNVAEVPAHASNTPVNIGEAAVWQATANDPETNNYYLIVCGTNAATPHNGAAPTCTGGGGETFCVSGATVSGGQSTCTDAAVTDPGAEFKDWYAFVCDNHATEAECSLANQGSGDSGTPLYINHAPTFASVTTSDNNKNPGGTFTVTATVNDTDIEGGADKMILSICSTNSWSTSTGCTAATWCTGSSTGASVSCAFATSTPAQDGSYGYYAFIKDWHELASGVNGRTANYTVNNVAPTVSNVVINGGYAISPNTKDLSMAYASSSADLYDANSCLDVNGANSATSSIFLSTVSGGLNCAADNNNCYQLTTSQCTYVAGSCTGPSDTTSSYICSTTIAFYASPSDNTTGNPNAAANWLAGMTAIDDNGLKGSATAVSGVEMKSTLGLGITETQIPYGAIRGGQNSGNNNATTTVVNFGNTPINTYVFGIDMDKSDHLDSIAANNQQYSLSNFSYGAGTALGYGPLGVLVNTVTTKPTSMTDVSDEIYWGINIPGGTSSGNYTGMNTFTADVDGTDWN